jgi:hypothetical protein
MASNNPPTIVLHNSKVKKAVLTPTDEIGRKQAHQVNGMNASALERKIESGEITVASTISRDAGMTIATSRQQKMVGEKTMTQVQLANLANQRGGKAINQKDISEMESGRLIMNHENKLKVRAVQKALGILKLDI